MKLAQTLTCFALLLVLSYGECLAQSNYKKGFIVKINGDTLSGYINYKQWYKNPRKFSFKLSPGDKNTETYSVDNATFIKIEGYAAYETFPVLVSMNEVQFTKLTESTSQPVIQDTVFLRLLVKGPKISLYSYRDQVKERFYILEKDQTIPLELSYKAALVDGSVMKFNTFREQLAKLDEKLSDPASQARPAIERSTYIEADLVKIIKSINGDSYQEPALTSAKSKSRRFYVAVGVNYSTINYSGKSLITADGVDPNSNILYKNRQTSSFLPLIRIGTDIYFKQNIGKVYMKLEISAASFASEVNSLYKFSIYSAEELANNYQLSGVILSLQPHVNVNIVNKENLKCYLGVGPSLHYLLPLKNDMYQKTNQQDPAYSDKQIDNYTNLKNLFASAMVRAGIRINKKLDISVCGYNPVELDNYKLGSSYSKYNSLQLSVAYIFVR